MSQVAVSRIESEYRDAFPESAALYERACGLFPSGVTHDGRFLRPFPLYVERSEGSKKYTVEGRELVDFWSGHGALLLGHGHPAVVDAVQRQMARGTHWSACHELEIRWGQLVRELLPSAERVRFTNSGTEATLMALRIARIATGRTKVLKFAGHFHGWHDQLIPAADPPHESAEYESPGITREVMDQLVVAPPNDLPAVERLLDEHQPACVILEPTGGRWGVVPVRGEFLQGLRAATAERGVPLIFDEVITGFRVSPGGAQQHYGVTPDLTSLAKILAGGLPGGALAGRADLMDYLAFDNPHGRKMPHHGTFNANPLSAAAGVAALEVVRTGEPCRRANETAKAIRAGLNELFARKSAPFVSYGDFSVVRVRPEYEGPRPEPGDDDFVPFEGDFRRLDAKHDKALLHAFRCALLLHGIDWMSWGGMINAAHTPDDVDQALSAFDAAIDLLREDGKIA